MREMGYRMILALGVFALAAAGPLDVEMSPFPIADAAEQGDRATVRALLQQGIDVNAAQGGGTTALHWAARANDVEMAEMLLYAGANVRATTRLGAHTPLLFASKHGNASMVETLLAAGADASDATTTGATVLMFASASGSIESVRLLLDREPDVNARESSGGQTALMFAAANGRHPVIEVLIERGADVSLLTDVIDVPTLNKAIQDGFKKRLEDLRKARAEAAGDDVAQVEDEKPKKSFFAKLFGWMIPGGGEEKAPPRRRREPFGDRVGKQGGMSALLFAARQGHPDSVRVLLEAGADIDRVAEGSETSPLLIATMNGHFDLAKLLVDEGADPNLASEPADVTPLYATINLAWAPRAAYPQPTAHKQQNLTHLELMEALLLAGADPNVRVKKKVWFMGYNFDRSSINETGATPFWRAAYGSDVAAMKLLRAFGAGTNIPTKNAGVRPPVANQRAREIKDVSGLEPVPVGGPAMSPLHGATGAGYGEGFAANDHRNHPAGFMPAVRYLVEECGADVNARDQEGSTPLHNAASMGHVELIEYLLSKGADVTAINREGRSTADMANGPVQRVQPFPEARDLLVSLGAVNNNRCVSC
ncbi:MAG: hypothetical protein E2P02_02860 [Acidobacteria bacterium]|nr:MAG: hypothetical protein E2P02_02860 [Acidobacteriota bacterium]